MIQNNHNNQKNVTYITALMIEQDVRYKYYLKEVLTTPVI